MPSNTLLDTSLFWETFSVAYSGIWDRKHILPRQLAIVHVHVAHVCYLISIGGEITCQWRHSKHRDFLSGRRVCVKGKEESNVCVYAILHFISSAFNPQFQSISATHQLLDLDSLNTFRSRGSGNGWNPNTVDAVDQRLMVGWGGWGRNSKQPVYRQ